MMNNPKELLKDKIRRKIHENATKSTSAIGQTNSLSLLAQFDEMIRYSHYSLISNDDLKSIIELLRNFDKYRIKCTELIKENQQKCLIIEKLENDAKQMQIRWDRIKRAYAREIKEKDLLQKSFDNLKKKMDLLRQMILEIDGQRNNNGGGDHKSTVPLLNQTKDFGKSTTSLISLLEQVDTAIPSNEDDNNDDESDDGLLFDKSDDSIDCNRSVKLLNISIKQPVQATATPSAPPPPEPDQKINIMPTINEVSNEKDSSILNTGFCFNSNKMDRYIKSTTNVENINHNNNNNNDNNQTLKPSIRSISEARAGDQTLTLNRQPSTQLSRTMAMLQNARSIKLDAERLCSREHRFVEKKAFKTKTICSVCEKNIGFCSAYGVCLECHGTCHNRCRDDLPKPCLPYMRANPSIKKMISLTVDSRTAGGKFLIIGDFVPDSIRPCIPPLLIHCCNEIDRRVRLAANNDDDYNVVGLYRISSTDQEVRELRRKILKSENGVPNLSTIISVYTICGVVKMFLRDLDDSLISRIMWNDFYRASVHMCQTSGKSFAAKRIDSVSDTVSSQSTIDVMNSPIMVLKRVICQLPLPNRDSLAFIMLHLHNVSNAESITKMNNLALANIFAPTIVGSSEFRQLSAEAMQREIPKQIIIMQALFEVEESFWRGILTEQNFCPFTIKEKSDEYGGRKSISSSEEQANFCANLAKISSTNLNKLLNDNNDNQSDDNNNNNNENDKNNENKSNQTKSPSSQKRSLFNLHTTSEQLNTPAIKRRSVVKNLKDALY